MISLTSLLAYNKPRARYEIIATTINVQQKCRKVSRGEGTKRHRRAGEGWLLCNCTRFSSCGGKRKKLFRERGWLKLEIRKAAIRRAKERIEKSSPRSSLRRDATGVRRSTGGCSLESKRSIRESDKKLVVVFHYYNHNIYIYTLS